MSERANHPLRIGSVLFVALCAANVCVGQPSNAVDLDKSILSQLREAYRAPHEVPQDLRDELRSYYKNPTPQREGEIFKEIRRLYLPTAQQEQAILQEIRKTYERWSPEQEARIYLEIDKAQRLPEGTVPPSVQARQVAKVFDKLDVNGDGALNVAEMPDALRNVRARWDGNRDGLISQAEYAAYYQGRLGWLSEQVATGKIDLGLKRGGPDLSNVPLVEEVPPPVVFRAGKLPADLPVWFSKVDTDKDGQIALFEWREAGMKLDEFPSLDLNNDGFATPEEVLRFVALLNREPAAASSNGRAVSPLDDKKTPTRK